MLRNILYTATLCAILAIALLASIFAMLSLAFAYQTGIASADTMPFVIAFIILLLVSGMLRILSEFLKKGMNVQQIRMQEKIFKGAAYIVSSIGLLFISNEILRYLGLWHFTILDSAQRSKANWFDVLFGCWMIFVFVSVMRNIEKGKPLNEILPLE